MPEKMLKEYLDRNRVPYHVIYHRPAFTAQEVAASAHIPGSALAKTVVVEVDHRLAMAVVPATKRVDLDRVKEAANAREVRIAREEEFSACFPGCEVGAEPPIGELYGMEVYLSADIARSKVVNFSGGTHSELINMAYRDYENLVRPTLMT